MELGVGRREGKVALGLPFARVAVTVRMGEVGERVRWAITRGTAGADTGVSTRRDGELGDVEGGQRVRGTLSASRLFLVCCWYVSATTVTLYSVAL